MKDLEILKIVVGSTGVSIDTRTLKPGNVFFALKGEMFDGNDYVELALSKGAEKVIASNKIFKGNKDVIIVDDTLVTLQSIAKLHRLNFEIPVIAVTGTNGKTTTKELLCKVLGSKFNPLCTKGNFNNHIGVPLTVLRLNNKHDIAVVELGASSVGEIKFLSELLNPTHGVITSIGKAHILGFKSLDNIVKTKLELFDYLERNSGTFFYNTKIEEIYEFVVDRIPAVPFSISSIDGDEIIKLEMMDSFPFISLKYFLRNGKMVEKSTKLYGNYNLSNISTAVKIGDYFGVTANEIINSINNYSPTNNRSQILEWKGNKVVLDAYNANPSSMIFALESFLNINKFQNKTLVLGDMLELGNDSLKEHKKIIEFIVSNLSDFESVLLIGREFKNALKEFNEEETKIKSFNNTDEAKEYFYSLNYHDFLILAKGSRGIKIEKLFLNT